MLVIYFDATKTEPKADEHLAVHTLGAYIGAEGNWENFREEWQSLLKERGLTYFHMTDFEYALSRAIANKKIPSRSPFHDWEKDAFIPFLRQLHTIINRKSQNGWYRLEGWASSIYQPDFDACLPNSLKSNPQCCSYYIFNVVQMMKSLALWANTINYKDRIHYVFANGDREGNNLERLFKYFWDRLDARKIFRLDQKSHRNSYDIQLMKSEPALQAADIVAYEMHKSTIMLNTNQKHDLMLSDLRASWQSLGKAPHRGLFYSQEQLIREFDEIAQGKIVL